MPVPIAQGRRRIWIGVAVGVVVVVFLCCSGAVGAWLTLGPVNYFGCGVDRIDVDEDRLPGVYVDADTGTSITLVPDHTVAVGVGPLASTASEDYPVKDGWGTWELDRSTKPPTVRLGLMSVNAQHKRSLQLDIGGDPDNLSLWAYIGDPDSCDLAMFRRA